MSTFSGLIDFDCLIWV